MATATTTTPPTSTPKTTLHPRFLSMLRVELMKIGRQRTTWITALLLGLLLVLFTFLRLQFGVSEGQGTLHDAFNRLGNNPAMYTIVRFNLDGVRQITGLFIIIVAARAIALDYQFGTIRVLLSRGTGRVRLLLAKLTGVTLVGLVAIVGGIILSAAISLPMILGAQGNLDAISGLPSVFYRDALVYLGTIVFNLVATLLFAVAISVLGRNQALGMLAPILYFFAEGIITTLLLLAALGTKNGFWYNIQNYLLGHNLDSMAGLVVSSDTLGQAAQTVTTGRGGGGGGSPFPFTVEHIDGTHTLVVTLVYCLVFAAIAFFLTRQRDVLE